MILLNIRKYSLAIVAVIVILITIPFLPDLSFFKQDAAYGNVRAIAPMTTKRSAHTATVLRSGQVLICGGIFKVKGNEINNSSAEIFNPVTMNFQPTGLMHSRRAGHTATLLGNGDVLIAGGFDSSGFLSSAELYHPVSGVFEEIGTSMSEKRASHTATLLPGGKVLLIGGVNGSTVSNSDIEVYDPQKKIFSTVGKLNIPRTGHTATLLPDGNVLIAGGSKNWRSEVLNSCEIYNPDTKQVQFTASMQLPRNKHVAVLLKNGTVLIAGGSSVADEIGGRYNSAEIFNAKTRRFEEMNLRMNDSRFKITNAADIVGNGNVVIAGDGKYLDIFDFLKGNFHTAKGCLQNAFMYQVVTALPDGKVLITGGYDGNMNATRKVWVYENNKENYASLLFNSFFIMN